MSVSPHVGIGSPRSATVCTILCAVVCSRTPGTRPGSTYATSRTQGRRRQHRRRRRCMSDGRVSVRMAGAGGAGNFDPIGSSSQGTPHAGRSLPLTPSTCRCVLNVPPANSRRRISRAILQGWIAHHSVFSKSRHLFTMMQKPYRNFRRPAPQPREYPQTAPRRWNDAPPELFPPSYALKLARDEWEANFDHCHGAYVSEAVYLISRIRVLAGYCPTEMRDAIQRKEAAASATAIQPASV